MLADTGRGLLDIAVITALAGVIIGVVSLTSLDFSFTFTFLNVAQSSIILLLVLTAIVNMVFGLSLPTTAVYILLAVLVGPALTKAGIVPIAAHLFIFYFGMLSTITPPVCLAAYTAASIAKADPMKTGWECMRLGILAYIVPFIFALSPALLLIGPWESVSVTVAMALLATVMLGVGLVGYLFQPIGALRRALFIHRRRGPLHSFPSVRPIRGADVDIQWHRSGFSDLTGCGGVASAQTWQSDFAPRRCQSAGQLDVGEATVKKNGF